ncbi:hypothetical protein BDR07DRAFT_1377315 [Suillus spraguei]|nr:hypothetical protein BDR07DRAFT_1377315 [Suillus spraguei]
MVFGVGMAKLDGQYYLQQIELMVFGVSDGGARWENSSGNLSSAWMEPVETIHPGLVVLEGQKKRHTKSQIAEDEQWAKEVQAVHTATLQCGINHIASIEAGMQAEQATQESGKGKLPVRSRPRPVKGKKGKVATTSELTSTESPVMPLVPAKVKSTGKHGTMGKDNDGVGAGDSEVIGQVKKARKSKKANTMSCNVISAATR